MAEVLHESERMMKALSQGADMVYRMEAVNQIYRENERQDNAASAYAATASALSQISPDHINAEAGIEKWRAFAGKHLDSTAMRELFEPMQRRLDINRQQIATLRERGLDNPITDDQGMIKWDESYEAATRKQEDLKMRAESWSDEGRYLLRNLQDAGMSPYAAMSAADRSEQARKLLEQTREQLSENNLDSTINLNTVRKRLMTDPNSNFVSVPVVGENGTVENLVGAGLGQYIYDYDAVRDWVNSKAPGILKEQKDAANLERRKTESAIRANTALAMEREEDLENPDAVVDGGQPPFNFEPSNSP